MIFWFRGDVTMDNVSIITILVPLILFLLFYDLWRSRKTKKTKTKKDEAFLILKDEWEMLRDRAEAFEEEGEFEKAVEARKNALEMAEEMFGTDSLFAVVSLADLGNSLLAVNQFEKAERVFLRAVSTAEKKFKRLDFLLSKLYNGIAFAYNMQDLFGKAEIYYMKSIAILEKMAQPVDNLLIDNLAELAILYFRWFQETSQAELLLERALKLAQECEQSDLVYISELKVLHRLRLIYELGGKLDKLEMVEKRISELVTEH